MMKPLPDTDYNFWPTRDKSEPTLFIPNSLYEGFTSGLLKHDELPKYFGALIERTPDLATRGVSIRLIFTPQHEGKVRVQVTTIDAGIDWVPYHQLEAHDLKTGLTVLDKLCQGKGERLVESCWLSADGCLVLLSDEAVKGPLF